MQRQGAPATVSLTGKRLDIAHDFGMAWTSKGALSFDSLDEGVKWLLENTDYELVPATEGGAASTDT